VSPDTELKTPAQCSPEELSAFESLVRKGFDGSDSTLRDRMARAACLAFRHDRDGALVAIAGLKSPDGEFVRWTFERAGSGVRPGDGERELGWVFVLPDHRGRGTARALCRGLLEWAGGTPVFATTRPDNEPMIHILEELDFVRAGEPFRRGAKELSLFILEGVKPRGVGE
jgi:RimJ/RimL family protein N-acetyltransferase